MLALSQKTIISNETIVGGESFRISTTNLIINSLHSYCLYVRN